MHGGETDVAGLWRTGALMFEVIEERTNECRPSSSTQSYEGGMCGKGGVAGYWRSAQ